MGRVNVVDLLGNAGLISWFGGSCYFALHGNGDMFQRTGTIGIAVAVAYFVAQRHADAHPTGMLERLSVMFSRSMLNNQAAMLANRNVVILAKALKLERERNGQEIPPTIQALAEVPIKARDASDDINYAAIERKNRENLVISEQANRSVIGARRFSEILQAVVVVAGTLQSGFGSLLFATPEVGG